MEPVECRYRGKLIGHLVVGPDGWLKYVKDVNLSVVVE